MSEDKFQRKRDGNFEIYSWTWSRDKDRDERYERKYPNKPDDSSTKKLSFSVEVGNVAAEIANLLVQKQADYGPGSISETPGGSLKGILVRMHDKVSRAVNLVFKSKYARNETLIDTFIDIAGYSIIAVLVLRNKWGNNEKDSRNF